MSPQSRLCCAARRGNTREETTKCRRDKAVAVARGGVSALAASNQCPPFLRSKIHHSLSHSPTPSTLESCYRNPLRAMNFILLWEMQESVKANQKIGKVIERARFCAHQGVKFKQTCDCK
ncbi:hypothetical protein RRG08_038032 [Elysia crispata]|uniref:Uncharacterized protein n=1 Tax=Elysia crispata TaxID=231223 RepID=A0AAE1DPD8_9GAST|nr:hypothetical protein RRG08_038032 [Elysia crispata]